MAMEIKVEFASRSSMETDYGSFKAQGSKVAS